MIYDPSHTGDDTQHWQWRLTPNLAAAAYLISIMQAVPYTGRSYRLAITDLLELTGFDHKTFQHVLDTFDLRKFN